MKGPLQTIDLSNDEEEGQERHTALSCAGFSPRCLLECEPVTALQFDELVRCVV